jgi:hypothetical protein
MTEKFFFSIVPPLLAASLPRVGSLHAFFDVPIGEPAWTTNCRPRAEKADGTLVWLPTQPHQHPLYGVAAAEDDLVVEALYPASPASFEGG